MTRGAVIEGIGVVSPLGVGLSQVSAALIGGRGIPVLTEAPPAGAEANVPARVSENVAEWFDSPKTYLDPASALTLAACVLARRDAGWDSPGCAPAPERCGIAMGTAYGCPDSMLRFWQSVQEKGPRLANPLFFTHSYPNTPASLESIEHGLKGPHLTFCQGAVSGGLALSGALDALRLGRADRMLAGAFDSIPPGAAAGAGAEAAVILALAPDAAFGSSDSRRVRLLGSGLSGFIPGEPAASAFSRAMAAALLDAEQTTPDLVVLAVPQSPPLRKAEASALVALAANGGTFACTTGGARFGPPAGASALLSTLIAAIALQEEWIVGGFETLEEYQTLDVATDGHEQPVSVALINSIDPAGAVVSVVVGRG